MTDYGALVECYRTKEKYLEKKLSKCQFVHHKSHRDWAGL